LARGTGGRRKARIVDDESLVVDDHRRRGDRRLQLDRAAAHRGVGDLGGGDRQVGQVHIDDRKRDGLRRAVQTGPADRQRIEERAEHHVDVHGTVVGLARLALVIGDEPHVFLVAGDRHLPFPFGDADVERQPLGGAAVVGHQVIGGAERRIGCRRRGDDPAVDLHPVARERNPG
jgi:hypothetical protein